MAKTKRLTQAAEEEKTSFAFDKVFAHYDDKIAGSTKYEHRTVSKVSKPRTFDRADHEHIVVSSQQLGWREKIDPLRLNLGLKATCGRNFYDKGHL